MGKRAKMDEHLINLVPPHQELSLSLALALLTRIVRPLVAKRTKTSVERSFRWAQRKLAKMGEPPISKGLLHQEVNLSLGHVLAMLIAHQPVASRTRTSAERFCL